MGRKLAAFVGLVCCVFAFSAPGYARWLPDVPVYVFGDSLSDVGNLFASNGGVVPPASRYDQGRFSNGPVWAETLADALDASPLKASTSAFDLGAGDSVGFAYGGAKSGVSNVTPDGFFTVPGALGQVEIYRDALSRQGLSASAQGLYVLWVGSNDYVFPSPGEADPQQVVGNIEQAINALYDLGARRFLVPNLLDLGTLPIATTAESAERLTRASTDHNRRLSRLIKRLDRKLPGAALRMLDIDTLVGRIIAYPRAFGFTNADAGPAAGCLFPPFQCAPVEPTGSVFWDELHPTARLHRLVGLSALWPSFGLLFSR